jgi:hypothetical protein
LFSRSPRLLSSYIEEGSNMEQATVKLVRDSSASALSRNEKFLPSSSASTTTKLVKDELNEISRQKIQIEEKLKKLSNENLQRLLHVSPSPDELLLTDQLDEASLRYDSATEDESWRSDLDCLSPGEASSLGGERRRSSQPLPFDDEDRGRLTRRKSGPASLKPVMRTTGETNVRLATIKKSVTFSTPRLSSLESEAFGMESVSAFKQVRKQMSSSDLIQSSPAVGGDKRLEVSKIKDLVSKFEKPENVASSTKEHKLKNSKEKERLASVKAHCLSLKADDMKDELDEINKKKEEIDAKLKELNDNNLKRLLHISPSPEALPITEKLSEADICKINAGFRPLIITHGSQIIYSPRPVHPAAFSAKQRHLSRRGPMPMPRPGLVRGHLLLGPQTSPPLTPGQMRTSPPLRPMPMHLYHTSSPTRGLIRITPRHLPPSYRVNIPRHLSPLHQGPPFYGPPRFTGPSPVFSPRSPLRTLRCAGQFSPMRPPFFGPSYHRFGGMISPRPVPPQFGPGLINGRPRYPSFAYRPTGPPRSGQQSTPLDVSASGQEDLATNLLEQQANYIESSNNNNNGSPKPVQKVRPLRKGERPPIVKASMEDIKLITSAGDNEKIIQVRGYGTVKIKTPEVAAAVICSDLLSAYRLSQSLSGSRPYKYNPSESMEIHRRLTVNSRKIFEKLTSPRKEKGPYVPNRDIMRLFRNDQRGREQLAMENEEMLYRHKSTYEREGEFFSPKNPDLIEKFQATHDYIRNLYIHSKSKFSPLNVEQINKN